MSTEFLSGNGNNNGNNEPESESGNNGGIEGNGGGIEGNGGGFEGTTGTDGNGVIVGEVIGTNDQPTKRVGRPKKSNAIIEKSDGNGKPIQPQRTYTDMGSDEGTGIRNANNAGGNVTGNSRTDTGTRTTATGKTETPVLAVSQSKPQKAPVKTQSVKEKKASTKAGDISPDEVNQFLLGVFGIASLVLGSHWVIEEDEGEQIAKPLTVILNKQTKKAKDSINGLMAPMLLVTAIGAIVVPRLLITISNMKVKKAHEPKPEPANRPNETIRSGEPLPTANSATDNNGGKGSPANGENGNYGVSSVPAAIRNNIINFN